MIRALRRSHLVWAAAVAVGAPVVLGLSLRQRPGSTPADFIIPGTLAAPGSQAIALDPGLPLRIEAVVDGESAVIWIDTDPSVEVPNALLYWSPSASDGGLGPGAIFLAPVGSSRPTTAIVPVSRVGPPGQLLLVSGIDGTVVGRSPIRIAGGASR